MNRSIGALPFATLEQLDSAYYSPQPAARAQLAQTLFASDPAAFRALFNEAARLLGVGVAPGAPYDSSRLNGAGNGEGLDVAPRFRAAGSDAGLKPGATFTAPENRASSADAPAAQGNSQPSEEREVPRRAERVGPLRNDSDGEIAVSAFPVAAYRAFESATNETLAREVRGEISRTLEQVLPEGTAEGASRRIADDIFKEIGGQLAADAQLSSQVGEVLRGWRFGPAEQQQVGALLAGRARQMLPSVARRMIGEWTNSVLATARTRAARSDAASRRVDVGNAASRPAGSNGRGRTLTPREIDYARVSDDDILAM